MKISKCLVYVMDYGAIQIEEDVTPTGVSILWKWCDIDFFDGVPAVVEGEYEEPIRISEDDRPNYADDMVAIVLEEGVKVGTDDVTWVTLAEQY